MKIVLFRIDERLIHGQIAHAWSAKCKPKEILVIDDEGVNDPLVEMTLEMAVPSGIDFSLLNTADSITYLKENKNNNKRVLIVVKSPSIPLQLIDNDIEINSINVGGMYYRKDKNKISKTVYLSDEDIELFKEIQERGVESEIRTNPSDKSVNLYQLI